MDPKTATKDPVGATPKALVRLAEHAFEPGSSSYSELCDAAHEMDQLQLRVTAAEQRASQAEARLFAVALVLRP